MIVNYIFKHSEAGAANDNMEFLIKDICQWLGNEFISASYFVINLVIIFDSHMRMDNQISAIVKSSFCSLRDMYKASHCLTRETVEMMVHALIHI